MSNAINIDLNCPICNNSENIILFTSVTVPKSQDLKEKLLKDELNIFNCTTCKSSCKIEIPVLYHDIDNQFAVWYSLNKSFARFQPLNKHYLFNAKIVHDLQSLKIEILLLEHKILTSKNTSDDE